MPDQVIQLRLEGRPATVNVTSKSSYWAVAKEVATWRNAAAWSARAIRLERAPMPCKITVVHEVRKEGRRKLPDGLACYWAYKGFQDGLVDADVLVDDGPTYVASTTFDAPQWSDRDALTFIIEPAGDVS